MGLSQQAWVEKTAETRWLSGKEKVPGAVKKVMLTNFWNMKMHFVIDFLEKVATVKSYILQNPLAKFTELNDPRINMIK